VLAAVAVITLVLVLNAGNDPSGTAGGKGSTTGAKEQARTATTPAAQQPATPPPPPAAAKSESPAQLNERGHQLILQERYAEAVAPLQASVAAYRDAGQHDLAYAFALYNLGVALNRSGNPADAIPYLKERLNYDNQLGTVRAELRDAQSKLGITGEDTKPGKGNKKKNG
jgi:tetratricopeptide (TPR) repeat protein